MKKLLLILALMASWAVNAQSLELYTFSHGVSQSQWITLSDNATQLIGPHEADTPSELTEIGFPFDFGSGTYTQFWINANGIFSFSNTPSTDNNTQFTDEGYNLNNPKICGISRNMFTGANGYVKYELTGTAPNRILVCEFLLFRLASSPSANPVARVNWQVQLYEADNRVVMVYGTYPTGSSNYIMSYQIGISQSGSDIWTIDPTTHEATHRTTYTTDAYSRVWPGNYRYYQFERSILCCPSPTDLTCTATTGSVSTPITATFSWTNGGSETQWLMEYDTNEDFSDPQSVTINQDDLVNGEYTLTGLTADVQYYGRIKAWCASCNGGEGAYSDPSDVCPFRCNVIAKPENITFTDPTINGVTVSWTVPTSNVTEYRYHYSADGGTNWSALESTTATTVTLSELPYVGHVYTFEVQAIYSDGESPFTSAVFITELCLPEDRCPITLVLTDSYGDGWKNNYLEVVDVETNQVLGTFTNTNMDNQSGEVGFEETQTFTLDVCDGRELSFQYVTTGEFPHPEENSWTITDVNGEIIWSYAAPTDNISLNYTISCANVNCKRPDNLQAIAVAHSASFIWTDGEEGQDAWQVSYSTDADFNPNNGTIVSITHDDPVVNGLEQSTTYYAYIRAYCGAEDYSRWSELMATFTTIAGNLAPTNLAVADEPEMTQTSATLNWEGVTTNVLHESYDLYYSTDSIMPETLNTANLITGISSNEYTIEALTPGTTYTVWVRDNCGDDGYSDWSEPLSFTTIDLCPTPSNLTLVEGSETNDGATIEWEGTVYNDNYVVEVGPIDFSGTPTLVTLLQQYQGQIPSDWTIIGNTIASWPAFGYGDPFCIRFYGESPEKLLVLPRFGRETKTLDISYWECPNNNKSGVFQVGYMTDANDPETFVELHTNLSSEGFEYQFVNISFADAPLGAHIAFRHVPVDEAGVWFLDDITIYERQYPVNWVTEGYAPDINSTGTYTIHGLCPSTLYKARVKSDCGDNGESNDYSNVIAFTTTAGQSVTFTKEITGYGNSDFDGYYLIASPLANYANPARVENMTDGAFDLYYYEQSEDLEWRNYETRHFNLESGKGYLYANSSDVTLTFTGVAYTGDGTVTLDYDENADLPGWNLIGNPFSSNATLSMPYYRLNEDGNALMTETESSEVEAMEGVFVQANEDGQTVTFTVNNGQAEPIAQTNIILKNSKGRSIDNAIVRFDNGAKLGKFQMNVNSPKLYIPENGKDYAVVNAGEVGELPLCFKANTDGSYTLDFAIEEVSFSYLHLIDNKTSMDVDLLTSTSYTFDARTTDYASRFRLLFATGSSISSETDTFGFVNAADNLCIFGIEGEAVLQVVDLTGRVISSSEFSGSYEQKLDVAPGMYMLRLINGNEVRTQKIILSSK